MRRLLAPTLLFAVAAAATATCKVRVSDDAHEVAFPCETSDVCPAPDHGCLIATCLEGTCVFIPAPNGMLPEDEQTTGDCKEQYCDGEGEVVAYASPHDVPNGDGNRCTTAVCDLDVPKNEPKLAGTPCPLPNRVTGVCNGAGTCGVCLPEARRCEEHAVVTCGADGAWGPAAACATDHPVCARGACTGVVELASGAHHACARFDDGNVRCWGDGHAGQRGQSGLAGATSAPWASGFSAVAFGAAHRCGLRHDGSVWCWGAGGFGQLGHGAHAASAAPVATGLKAIAVAAGDDHSCALVAGGLVHCWGAGDLGQLGSGALPAAPLRRPLTGAPREAQPVPQGIAGLTDAALLSVAANHTCVTRAGGQTRCWGLEALALGAPSDDGEPPEPPSAEVLRATSAKPKPVPGLKDALELGCGAHHCCARLQTGGVSCWGAGAHGALGQSDTANSPKPLAVPGVGGAQRLAVGRHFACVLLADASVACFGANDRGQLGTGSGDAMGGASVISTLGRVKRLTVGDHHGCALLESGELMCWGDNGAGQLGRSEPAMARQPVAVAWGT